MTIQGRVFLVGCPRSGTTLLQCLLGANSRIASFPESQFYVSLFSDRPWAARLGIASRRARLSWQRFVEAIQRPELLGRLPRHALSVRQSSAAFVGVLDQLTLEQGKSVWLDKSPGHLLFAEQIESLVPGTKFIHLVRHGPDVVASLHDISLRYPAAEWGSKYRSLEVCIQRWVRDTRLSWAYAARPNHCLVRYEDLLADPTATLTRLCRFVGVAFEDAMLSDYRQVAGQVIQGNEAWSASTFEPLRFESGAKFHTVLDASQQRYVLEHIPPDLLSTAFISYQTPAPASRNSAAPSS